MNNLYAIPSINRILGGTFDDRVYQRGYVKFFLRYLKGINFTILTHFEDENCKKTQENMMNVFVIVIYLCFLFISAVLAS